MVMVYDGVLYLFLLGIKYYDAIVGKSGPLYMWWYFVWKYNWKIKKEQKNVNFMCFSFISFDINLKG